MITHMVDICEAVLQKIGFDEDKLNDFNDNAKSSLLNSESHGDITQSDFNAYLSEVKHELENAFEKVGLENIEVDYSIADSDSFLSINGEHCAVNDTVLQEAVSNAITENLSNIFDEIGLDAKEVFKDIKNGDTLEGILQYTADVMAESLSEIFKSAITAETVFDSYTDEFSITLHTDDLFSEYTAKNISELSETVSVMVYDFEELDREQEYFISY